MQPTSRQGTDWESLSMAAVPAGSTGRQMGTPDLAITFTSRFK